MPLSVLQWNCCGFQTRLPFTQKLVSDYNPDVICIQETNLKENQNASLRRYTSHCQNRTNYNRASGGVAILTRNSITSNPVQITSPFEAIAIKLLIPTEITICNIYLPDSQNLNLSELTNLINQLPSPFLLLGDFNARNILWGSNYTDTRGRVIESLLLTTDIVLLNTGESTHFSAASGSFSSIDLSLCSPSLVPSLDWQVIPDLYDSDHFPLMISSKNKNTDSTLPGKWKIRNANWESFTEHISSHVSEFKITDTIDHCKNCSTTS